MAGTQDTYSENIDPPPAPPAPPIHVVGYKLVSTAGDVVETWGGVWGSCPGIPNPVHIPTGDLVHAPQVNVDYNGYRLIEWAMEEPPPAVPESITPRQVRLLLLQQNLLANVEAMIAQRDEATRITWEYALQFQRNDPLLADLASDLGLTDQQIDEFFIAASLL